MTWSFVLGCFVAPRATWSQDRFATSSETTFFFSEGVAPGRGLEWCFRCHLRFRVNTSRSTRWGGLCGIHVFGGGSSEGAETSPPTHWAVRGAFSSGRHISPRPTYYSAAAADIKRGPATAVAIRRWPTSQSASVASSMAEASDLIRALGKGAGAPPGSCTDECVGAGGPAAGLTPAS